jgi:DNA-binding GntR family transcriptional regulator
MPKADLIKSERSSSRSQKQKTQVMEPPVAADDHGTALEKNKSARDRIRGAVLKRISDGVYLPGERLKEMKLAQEFEVSQAPVREAFRELETLGVVVSKHYRGTHVREVSSQETYDAYELRGYLEEVAVQMIPAAKLKEEIGVIEALQVTMRKAARSGDADGFARANTQFHRSIVSLASNQTVLKVWDSLEIGMRSRLNLQKNEHILRSLAEIHQPIVDSLQRGDLKGTGVLLREHAFSFLKDLP